MCDESAAAAENYPADITVGLEKVISALRDREFDIDHGEVTSERNNLLAICTDPTIREK